MPNPTTFDTESEDFRKGARLYAIEMLLQKPGVTKSGLLLIDLTSDDKDGEDNDS